MKAMRVTCLALLLSCESASGLNDIAFAPVEPIPTKTDPWGVAFVSNQDDVQVTAILADGDETVVAGWWNGTVDFGAGVDEHGSVVGSVDAFLLRYDVRGGVIAQRFMGPGGSQRIDALAKAPNGDLVIVGTFENSIDVTEDHALSANIGPNIFVAVFGSDGTHRWSHVVGGDEATANASSVAVTEGGHIVVAGLVAGEVSLNDGQVLSEDTYGGGKDGVAGILLFALSPSGALGWHAYLAPEEDTEGAVFIRRLLPGPGDSVYLAATVNVPLAIDTQLITPAGFDVLVTKYGVANHEWSVLVGSSGDDELGDMAVDRDGNVYLQGRAPEAFAWGSAMLADPAFIVELDAGGNPGWAQTYDPSFLARAASDADGQLLLAGTADLVKFGSDQPSVGGLGFFLARLDPAAGNGLGTAFFPGGVTALRSDEAQGWMAVAGELRGQLELPSGTLAAPVDGHAAFVTRLPTP